MKSFVAFSDLTIKAFQSCGGLQFADLFVLLRIEELLMLKYIWKELLFSLILTAHVNKYLGVYVALK